MEDLKNVVEPIIDIKFKCRKDRQKYLIEFILTYGNLNLKELAGILGVNILILSQVIIGLAYLSGQSVIRLIELFSMLFSD